MFFFLLFGMLPMISDRVLTPTRKSEPRLVSLWKRSNGTRAGVCFTGVNKDEFSPKAKTSEWGRTWQASKEKYLAQVNKKHLLLCVGRTSPEKGVDGEKVFFYLYPCRTFCTHNSPFYIPGYINYKNLSKFYSRCQTAPCGWLGTALSAQ